MQIMDDYCWDIFNRIAKEANHLAEYNKKSTVTSREVQTAVRLILPGELAKHAVSEGTKAVTKFNSSECDGRRGSQSSKAGLQFPVGRVKTALKKKLRCRIGRGAPIYLAAVMEYMVAEVLELSGNAARDNKKVRIIPRHILLALLNDEELNKFCRNVCIVEGGVIPNIHSVLLPPKSHKQASYQQPQAFGGSGFGGGGGGFGGGGFGGGGQSNAFGGGFGKSTAPGGGGNPGGFSFGAATKTAFY
mmetsp:Transcript_1355/g.4873  ORF Transcript_1355/g.4873 Transcript_1355/m.4873 type:complete len:246 (+) Transcript_1355:177-914(+)